jgi:hypothetical protein
MAHNDMKKYSITLIISEMQIKTKLRFHLTTVIMVIILKTATTISGENRGKRKLKHC